MKILRLILLLVVITIAIVLLLPNKKKIEAPVDVVIKDSIKGCYEANLDKDVYTLRIESVDGENVKGRLSYNNFEKDSSSGDIEGEYKDKILLANYSFHSEGLDSIREVIFKKTDSGFIQGFGPIKMEGQEEKFENLNYITYDESHTFKKINCDQIDDASILDNGQIEGEASNLKIGQSKIVNGLSVLISSLVSDSRCPIDVECIQAGKVSFKIVLAKNGQTKEIIQNYPGTETMWQGYKFSILQVQPQLSRERSVISETDYIITINVKKTQ